MNNKKKSDKYKTLMIKRELKELMDDTIINVIKKKMSYSDLIIHLIGEYREKEGLPTFIISLIDDEIIIEKINK